MRTAIHLSLTYLLCEKIHQLLSSTKKDAHKRKLVPFFCLTVYVFRHVRTFVFPITFDNTHVSPCSLCIDLSRAKATQEKWKECDYDEAIHFARRLLRILVNTNQARETGRTKFIDRHCLQSMRSRFYVTLGCPSVGTSHQSTSAAAWGRFAAERRASRSYRSTAADA